MPHLPTWCTSTEFLRNLRNSENDNFKKGEEGEYESSLQKILLKICQEIEGVLAEINGMERRVREGRGVSRKKGERVRVSERDEIERERERERQRERETERKRERRRERYEIERERERERERKSERERETEREREREKEKEKTREDKE